MTVLRHMPPEKRKTMSAKFSSKPHCSTGGRRAAAAAAGAGAGATPSGALCGGARAAGMPDGAREEAAWAERTTM